MTDQIHSHPTQGRRRRHKSPAILPGAQPMPLPTLLDHMDAADVRNQNLLLLDLRLVDHRTSMMRLGVSLKWWNHGMRKGLKREMIRIFRMLKKLPLEKLTLVVGQNERPMGLAEIHGGLGSATLRGCIERTRQYGTS